MHNNVSTVYCPCVKVKDVVIRLYMHVQSYYNILNFYTGAIYSGYIIVHLYTGAIYSGYIIVYLGFAS